uniref:Uncharacterized protein n=2 Tax=Klebsiella pneumoniae TaxID=573 RepID=A0A8F7PYV3_KLEPN|nr:hypothetical protein pKpnU95_00236 [Klebsiella pneumoniae]QXV89926.1 hypothetical protein [Klebsiella pneumoniae subsp. pneumoniae]QQM13235.1 hypothetical protein [Klebsiella pneumoniae]QVI03116.1 hypothetical protein [Klebsiella pneumoniae]QXV90801.1 hypothetical protein [Klebsiella pneumoniae subsp. pneumoniae]
MSYSNFRWLIERITQLKSHERGNRRIRKKSYAKLTVFS